MWPFEFYDLNALAYPMRESSQSIIQFHVLNYESQKRTHFTLIWSYLTIFDHVGGPIDVAL